MQKVPRMQHVLLTVVNSDEQQMTISPWMLAISVAPFLEYPYYGYRKVLAMSECIWYAPIMPEMKLVCSLSATVSSHISSCSSPPTVSRHFPKWQDQRALFPYLETHHWMLKCTYTTTFRKLLTRATQLIDPESSVCNELPSGIPSATHTHTQG